MSENHDFMSPSLKFDDLTKKTILQKLQKAFAKSRDKGDSEGKGKLLISILEGFSDSYQYFYKFKPESQERRRERLTSIVKHLEAIVDQLNKIDDAAAEYACFLSFNELIKLENPKHLTPNTYTFKDMIECASFNETLPQTLTAFANGIRDAEKSLPLHSHNTSGKDANWYSAPPQLSVALALERQFWEFGLKFTVTNTGLAADCLQAIYSHAGVEVERVDYWLRKARDHKDSMINLMKKTKSTG